MKIKLGIFYGGKSVEHEVSIITALQAMENIDKDKYEIIPIYISKTNKMYCGNKLFEIENYKDINKLIKNSKQITLVNKENKVALLKCKTKLFENEIYNYIDIAFPIVHGTNVEDGTLQGYLKMFDIPYIGSDVISSSIGMDKYACKCILKENNIPVLDCLCFTLDKYYSNTEEIITNVEDKFEYPVIVKPVNLGSSIGIKLAKNKNELKEALKNAFEYSNKVIIEKAIENLKEVNCSVLGNYENAQASECEEPIKKDDILSFKDKYISGGKKIGSKNEKTMNAGSLKLPAKISNQTKQKIQKLSLDTFKILGCNGVIRIDFIIDKDTEEIYVNEVNTIPGCLSFHLWRESKLSYKELLNKVIELGLKRYREESNITFSFESNILSTYSGGTKISK